MVALLPGGDGGGFEAVEKVALVGRELRDRADHLRRAPDVNQQGADGGERPPNISPAWITSVQITALMPPIVV